MANTQLGDTQKVPYSYALNDADSNFVNLASGQAVTVTSADPASATIVPDAVPAAGADASGFIVGGAKLATGLAVTFSCKNADGTNVVPDVVDLLDIVAGSAVSAAVTLGTPVSQ